VDAGHAEAERVELGCLVVHQRDQRRDDQRCAAARNRRQLVAERFARARRHHQQHIEPLHRRAAYRLLVHAESAKTEALLQQSMQSGRGR
jgi:hypothetical protein